MILKFFNTLSRQKEVFQPLNKKNVKIYSCGPTVYDYPHIGNLRAFLFTDTLVRWLQYGEKYQVQWVMNITDVDDKTIQASFKKFPTLPPKEALKKFTRYFEEIFFQDLEKLNILKKNFYQNPRATEFIPSMQNFIKEIYQNGFAKIIKGSVFFDLKKFNQKYKYGQLLKLNLENLKTGTRSLADETEKDNLQDFVLWKGKKENEPYWDFELDGHSLPGRPGWHIECSAMSKDLLNLPFDIHTGGVDLIFPHHENEIAQAQAAKNKKTANFWLHNEHFLVKNKKMSKSLGNFLRLADLKNFSFASIRFFFAVNHYRQKLNLSDQVFQAASNTLEKIRNSIDLFQKNNKENNSSNKKIFIKFQQEKEKFFSFMRDDLNTPLAIAVFLNILKIILPEKFSSTEKKEINDFLILVDKIFGVDFFPQKRKIPSEIIALAQERQKAKKEKDFKKADDLRDQILKKGFILRDRGNDFEILAH